MTSHDLSALTGAYALDALDESERALFEAHLAGCPDCAAEVRSLRAAAAELSHATAAAPPPQLRGDVLAGIATVRPLPPRVDRAIRLRAHRPSQRLWQAVAAACALIAVVAAGWGYQQHRDARERDPRATAISAILDSPDATAVTGDIGGAGRAALLYSKSERRLVLIGHDIPAPAEHKTYQLWMIGPQGNAASAGLFAPDNDGNVLVRVTGDLADTAQIGISVEPAGGSPRPTPGAILATLKI